MPLSVRDETKPFILIAAIVVGIMLNRFVGGVMQELYGLVIRGGKETDFSLPACGPNAGPGCC